MTMLIYFNHFFIFLLLQIRLYFLGIIIQNYQMLSFNLQFIIQFMKQYLIFILLLISTNSHFLDYTTQYQINCNKITSYSKQSLWHTLILHQVDKIGFLILCPITILCTLFVIYTYYKYPSIRKSPGDIFLVISIIDLLLAVSQFYYAFYVSMNPEYTFDINEMPDDFQSNCTFVSISGVFLGTAEVVYNLCFSVYLIFSIKRVLKGRIKQWYYHLFSFIISFIITGIVIGLGQNGLSIFGTCTYAIDKHIPYTGIIVIGLYLIFALVSLIIFKKSVPKVKQLNRIRNYFLKYYFIYIIVNFIIWMTLSVSNLILIINCLSMNPNTNLQIFITIGNLSKLGTPIVLSIVRFNNPSVKFAFKKVLKNFKKHIKDLFSSKDENMTQSRLTESFMNIQRNFIDEIKTNLRSRQIYSFLYGIQKISKINSQNEKDIITSIDAKQQQKILNFKITQHQSIYTRPFRHQNFLQSLSIDLNLEQIYNQGYSPDGGKSGQFFYYTGNHKYIIKTITKIELDVYKKRAQSFYKYFITHQNSLIIKILGIYTFMSENNEDITIIVMRNIAPTDKVNIIRTFDLKGSKYNRKVLKKEQQKQQIQMDSFISKDKFEKTLKDTDFQKMERKIFIQSQQLVQMKYILDKDAEFLKAMKLIDYSLIIMICIYTQPQKQRILQFSDKYSFRSSNIEQNIYYHFGIVDYLQIWNLKKNMQKKTKKIINLGKTIDTSSQDQVFYAERFKENVVRYIFRPDTSTQSTFSN